MIRGLVTLLVFQGLGEVIARVLSLPVPGPVVGLCLLLAALHLRGRVDPDLDLVASGFCTHLGLLFVPAAVGVVMFLPELREHGLIVGAILAISVVLAMAAAALVLRAVRSPRS